MGHYRRQTELSEKRFAAAMGERVWGSAYKHANILANLRPDDRAAYEPLIRFIAVTKAKDLKQQAVEQVLGGLIAHCAPTLESLAVMQRMVFEAKAWPDADAYAFQRDRFDAVLDLLESSKRFSAEELAPYRGEQQVELPQAAEEGARIASSGIYGRADMEPVNKPAALAISGGRIMTAHQRGAKGR